MNDYSSGNNAQRVSDRVQRDTALHCLAKEALRTEIPKEVMQIKVCPAVTKEPPPLLQ